MSPDDRPPPDDTPSEPSEPSEHDRDTRPEGDDDPKMTDDEIPPADDTVDPEQRDRTAQPEPVTLEAADVVARPAGESGGFGTRRRGSLIPGLALALVVVMGLTALTKVSGSTAAVDTVPAGGDAPAATPTTFTIQPAGECTLDVGDGVDPPGTSVEVALQYLTQLPAADPVAHASDLAVLADGRFVITRRDGMVYTMAETAVPGDAVWDIRADTDTTGTGGLIGMAVDPAEAWLYVLRSTTDGNVTVVASPMTAGFPDASVSREILSIPRSGESPVGGGLAFDDEGRLLIGLASGADDPRAGSILRIQPTPASAEPYTIPADNPDTGDGTTEVLVDGLTNPYRLSVDAATGALWLGDATGECEGAISVVETDGEGDGSANPLLVVPEACRILGGFVYRGAALPGLDGAYIFGDSCQNYVRALWVDDTGVRVEQLVGDVTPLVAIEPDAAGEPVLLASDGLVNRLVPSSSAAAGDGQTTSSS